jgi:hypothetical protein
VCEWVSRGSAPDRHPSRTCLESQINNIKSKHMLMNLAKIKSGVWGGDTAKISLASGDGYNKMGWVWGAS